MVWKRVFNSSDEPRLPSNSTVPPANGGGQDLLTAWALAPFMLIKLLLAPIKAAMSGGKDRGSSSRGQ